MSSSLSVSPTLSHHPGVEPELEAAFERLVDPPLDGNVQPLKIVIPSDALHQDGLSLAQLLTNLVADYDEIDSLLDGLKDSASEPPSPSAKQTLDDAIAFVSDAELADPQALSRAVEPLQTARGQLDLQLAKLRHCLDRLDVYRLSRLPSHALMPILQQPDHLDSLHGLEDFLRSLNRAADAFEALDLPRPHIRDFLRHLCAMSDWQEMGHLVHVLEAAVQGALRQAG